MRAVSILVLAICVGAAGAAEAQVFREPCRVESLCPGVQKGGGRIVACLRTHKANLSEQCYAALGRFMINRTDRRGGGQSQGPGGQGPGGQGPGGQGPMEEPTGPT